jgi:hypothetical protein
MKLGQVRDYDRTGADLSWLVAVINILNQGQGDAELPCKALNGFE